MKRTTRTALSLLTSLTLHSIGFTAPTLAETITRGPNFAAHPVKAAPIPVDAQVQKTTADTLVPSVVTKGSNGAAHLAQPESVRKTSAQPSGTPNIITRGPNSAAHILN
ncbi:hypothetical protein [Acaryochloris sp. IP29b_bin.137]|uniref:hypothetical protein n=1 Tax=Acaryochloris sp. IP29b_bin.137 TaxID=2969217 RepID=UPI002606FBE5|nr:hypothetical protein [Acaryochloris sp. IP29b_bin.137]